MKKLLWSLLILAVFVIPCHAADISQEQAEAVGASSLTEELPEEAAEVLSNVDLTGEIDFWGEFKLLLYQALTGSDSALKSGMKLCAILLAVVTLCAIVKMASHLDIGNAVSVVGALGICAVFAGSFQSMLHLATETLEQLTEYTGCLLPVLASAVAMSGGMASSTAMYTGTVIFSELLMQLITKVLTPIVYFYLVVATAEAALASDMLSEIREFIGWLVSKSLRIILFVFTGYMSISGVISGTSDAAAVKATKAVSGMVPVVGGILSDASDTLLASASTLKNCIGVFGMLAILAICLTPFLQVGIQYLLLKGTAAISGTIGMKPHIRLLKNFSSAMGYLLAMNGTCALMMLISAVCFLKVVS